MKKQLLFLLTFFVVLFFSTGAFCLNGVYVTAGIGATFMSDSEVTDTAAPGETLEFESDTGYGAYLAVGYEFKNNIRVEGEVSYQVNDNDKTVRAGTTRNLSGDTKAIAFLVNGYYDFNNKSSFTPFITGGVGLANIETAEFYLPGAGFDVRSDDDTVFAWQVGAGISYAISNKTVIDLKYRYFGTDEASYGTVEKEFFSHNVYIGTRLKF